ncbi:MAG: GPR1/FUN34/YaaH family transporter, partial [Epsilonproteobacteria bacterium]|nr:GPR1/FUN34/YaaH family transporter [Campylobacterota bacterium]
MVEKTTNSDINIKSTPVTIAEPAAFGLFGLAVAAFVLGATDLGLTSGSKSLMIPWVLMFGATAQLVASVMDFKRKNIFGATVFGIYAMAMYSIALTLLITIFGGEKSVVIAHYTYGLMAILIFSLIATVASLMTNKVLFLI